MDTPELRRSALERKDRDELVTIASTLGAKPPSRARKAEIVDLILTTVTTDAADEAGDSGDDAGDAGEETTSEASTDAAPADDGAEEEFDFGEVKTQAPRERNESKGRNRSKGQGGGNDAKGDNGKNEADKGGEPNDQKGQNNGNDEPAGPGNRRPRRRGRGRDQRDDATDGEPVRVEGVLDLRDDGYGFLRVHGWRSSKEDAYVSVKQVRQNGLRKGDHLSGTSRPANRNEKNPALLTLDSVNGAAPEAARERPDFDVLTPVHPDEQLVLTLEDDPSATTGRILDLLAPVGKGTRGLIVAPPKSGKTRIIKDICTSIETNSPDVNLIVLLIDERPEEVTAMRRALEQGEVAASSFDRPADEHVAVAEITIERAKRLVESGQDVVIVLDSLTRLARSYDQASPSSGRTVAGGVDVAAIHAPKRFFGAARNVEEGGSLSILATISAETGSVMDDAVLESFRETANMELRLQGGAEDQGLHPAVDVAGTTTRHADQLVDEAAIEGGRRLRRAVVEGADDALAALLQRLSDDASNDAVLKKVK